LLNPNIVKYGLVTNCCGMQKICMLEYCLQSTLSIGALISGKVIVACMSGKAMFIFPDRVSLRKTYQAQYVTKHYQFHQNTQHYHPHAVRVPGTPATNN
jgi:hypothetical protein